MTNLIHPATREEWLKIRHGYVSSTESAALFSMSPYLTAYELALLKTDKLTSDFEGNERTAWGTRLEDAIARGIGEDYGVIVKPQKGYAVHPDCKMGASFDYEIVGILGNDEPAPEDVPAVIAIRQFKGDETLRDLFRKHGPGVLEIKNVDSLIYKQQWADEPPAHIDIQVQHQLECIRYPWAVIGVLVGGNRNEILVRDRDPKVGAALRSKILKFWADLAEGILPPVTMPEDTEILIRLYNYAEPGKLYDGQEDAELGGLCESYAAHGDIIKLSEEAREVAKAKILQRIGEAERATMPGFSVSAGMVGECEIAYTRKAYRNFRVTQKKVKTSGKK